MDTHKHIQKYIFLFLPIVLYISLDCFGVSCLVLEISAERVEIPASNIMGLNDTKWMWCSLFTPKIHLKNSTVMSLPKNHDPVTQNNNPNMYFWFWGELSLYCPFKYEKICCFNCNKQHLKMQLTFHQHEKPNWCPETPRSLKAPSARCS